MKILSSLAAATLFALPMIASAQVEHSLKMGDAAPPLKVGKWIKGEPVKGIEAGKLHVLEFWATWCGPCVAVIPHVSELQKQNPDVVFIGVNVWEDDPEKVGDFVKDMGAKMDYRVALDDTPEGADKGKMAETWLEAAGQNGIPCSFLIGKDGKILWIGHPSELEEILKSVQDGTYDPAAVQAAAAKQEELERKFAEAMDGVQSPEDALAALEKLGKESPELVEQTIRMRFGIMISALKDYDGAYKLAAEIAEDNKDEPQVLNELAWTILTAPGLEKRDIGLAFKTAERAVELTKGEDAALLDTLARAHFELGREKAIELQKKAVEKADEENKELFQSVLDAYSDFDPHSAGNPEDETLEEEMDEGDQDAEVPADPPGEDTDEQPSR